MSIRKLGLLFGVFILSGCAHRTMVTRGTDFSVYETSGVRIYLSSSFQKGLIGMDSEEEFQRFYLRMVDDLGTLIARGLLTGKTFFEALGESPRDTGVLNLSLRELFDVDAILAADPGPLIKILYYEDESDPGDLKKRKYDLWVTFNPIETGLGSFHHFTLELENAHSMKQTTPREFTIGARIVKLKYEGIEL